MLNIEPLFDLSYRVHPSIDICKFAFHCHFSIYHRRGLFSQVGLDVIQIVRSLSACQRDPGASNFFFIQVESEWGRARRKSTICFDGALRTFETRLRVFIPPILTLSSDTCLRTGLFLLLLIIISDRHSDDDQRWEKTVHVACLTCGFSAPGSCCVKFFQVSGLILTACCVISELWYSFPMHWLTQISNILSISSKLEDWVHTN